MAVTHGEHSVARHHLALLTPFTIRVARIERTVRRGKATMALLQQLAGGSRATVKRDLEVLRDLGAVITYNAFDNGYELRNPEWPGVLQVVAEELRRWA